MSHLVQVKGKGVMNTAFLAKYSPRDGISSDSSGYPLAHHQSLPRSFERSNSHPLNHSAPLSCTTRAMDAFADRATGCVSSEEYRGRAQQPDVPALMLGTALPLHRSE